MEKFEKGIEKAESQIDYVVEEKMEAVAEKAEIAMERESNLKITAISECIFTDTCNIIVYCNIC